MSDSTPFCCECDTPERTPCEVTGHDGDTSAARYCDGCLDLARIDWTGETRSVRTTGPRTANQDHR